MFKILVEHHPEGYLAYPLGLKGIVVGEGDTADEAIADARSAIRFHIETFGEDVIDEDAPLLDAMLVEAEVFKLDVAISDRRPEVSRHQGTGSPWLRHRSRTANISPCNARMQTARRPR